MNITLSNRYYSDDYIPLNHLNITYFIGDLLSDPDGYFSSKQLGDK